VPHYGGPGALVREARPFALLLAIAIAAPLVIPPAAGSGGPRVNLRQRTWIDLQVTPLNADAVDGETPERMVVRVGPREGGETEFALVWPDKTSKSDLRLRAEQVPAASNRDHAVDLKVELTLPSGRTVLSQRRIELDDRATVLFEVYRHEERPLTLVIEAESSEETVISKHPVVGAPVRFMLEIQRVEQGRTISLETNTLQAFEGQAVSYSFRLGSTPEADAARVSLRPLRVSGAIVEIEVETEGKLPSEDGLLVVGRRERWIASRGTTSTLAFESGEPPTGYRFLVTADF
jgi:hypothetical protein